MNEWAPLFLIVSVAGAGIGAWFGAYLREKGKHYATREDLEKIEAELRRTTRAAEEVKADISGDLWVRQKRWDLKLDFYMRVFKALFEVKEALRAIASVMRSDRARDLEGAGRQDREWESATQRLKDAEPGLADAFLLAPIFLSADAVTLLEDLSRDLKNVDRAHGPEGMIPSLEGARRTLVSAAKRDLLGIPAGGAK